MLDSKRRAIAYIAGSLITGNASGNVYDYSYSGYFNFAGTVSNNISVYDYSRSCYLTGSPTSIYDYGSRQFVNLSLDGNQFSGYDYETNSHFMGQITGNIVALYDYQQNAYYNFIV